jgi:alpha-D-xyloside xylohydrolase
MKLINFTVQPNGLLLETSRGQIALTAFSSDIVRIRYTLESAFSSAQSLLIIPAAQSPAEVSIRDTNQALFFSTSKLTIQINRDTLAFTYRDAQGKSLTREPERGGKTLMPVDVIKFIPGEGTGIETQMGADGLKTSASTFKEIVDRQAYHTKLEFEWADGEALYGLGSHEEGMFNLRGQHQYLYQQNMKAVVPVLLSTRGYGILLDSCSLMTFHDDAFGSYLWSDIDDELDYYFLYGPEFDQIVHEIRTLTGHSPMLPKWAFGYIQSKERYMTQAELLSVVREYRRRELPLDGIVLDWKTWTGDLWGQKTFDPDRFPDPSQMTADLHELNAHLMVSIWPIMRPGGENWQEMKENGHLLSNQATYNAFSAAARACYWKQANQGLFSRGVDAWWCDCTEPFEADWKGAVKPEPEERLRINTEEAKRYLDPEQINAYSLLHSQGIYEGQRQVTSEKRVINLTRSAYLGQQRYATITWSGDISARWETLRGQIADGLNFCATGMPYWTVDIGAYFVHSKPELWFWNGDYDEGVADLGYRELFVRWFQYGAFLPMFRAHGTDTPREIWQFGQPGEPFYEALVSTLRLRYQLLPYIYSLAGWTTQHDYTLLRALPFDFRCDLATYDINDQFMFGPALMVSPVTRPMLYDVGSQPLAEAAQTRPIYLPAGVSWYDFWTGQLYSGGQTIQVDAPIDHLPLFVRAGSILPMGPVRQHVQDVPAAPLELHIYPGQNSAFELYEDEGDQYNYEDGAFTLIPIGWQEAERQLTLGARQGRYDGMPEERTFGIFLHGAAGHQPGASPARPDQTICYDGQPVVIQLETTHN